LLTYTPTATARHAAAQIGATSSATTDLVTVTVADASGAAVSQAVTVPVTPKNSAPTATKTIGTPDLATGVVTGTITGADADKDTLTYSVPATTAKGTVAITGTGAFTYTPTAAARHAAAKVGALASDKTDTFSVTIADGYTGGTVSVPVTVAIRGLNTAPTATVSIGKPDPVTGVVRGTVTAADADQDKLTYTASTPANGTVVVGGGGTFTYTPTAAARTAARASATAVTDRFTITVADGYGGSKPVSVTATIAPSNSAPVAGTPTATANPTTGVVTGGVNATDPDKDTLTYTAAKITTSKGIASVTNTGAFTYTPTAPARHAAARIGATADEKTDAFTVMVKDKYGASSSIPVMVTIPTANAAPVVATPSVSAPSATGVVTGTVTATDADSDPVTFGGSATTAKGTVTVASNGGFTYTPTAAARHAAARVGAPDSDRIGTFTVTASDGYGGTVPISVSVAIAPSNTVPVARASTVGLPDATTAVVTGRVNVIDADKDSLTYTGSLSTSKGNVAVAPDGSFTYTPTTAARHAAAKVGALTSVKSDTFTVTAADGYGGTVNIPVKVTIAPANSVPVFGAPVLGTPNAKSGIIVGSVGATDTDNDALTFSGSATTAKGAVKVASNGAFTYTPSNASRNIAGSPTATEADLSDSFTVTVKDGYGGSVQIPVTVVVTPNKPPVAKVSVQSGDRATGTVTGRITTTDPEGETVTITAGTTTTDKGTFTVNADGTFTFTPTLAARRGSANPTYEVVGSIPWFGAPNMTADGTRFYAVEGGLTGRVIIANTVTNSVEAPIEGFKYPKAVAVSPDGKRAYVTDVISATNQYGKVSVVDTTTNSVIAVIQGFRKPNQVVVSPDGTRVYVADEGVDNDSTTIAVIDTATNSVIAKPTSMYRNILSMAVSPDGRSVYIGHYGSVSVLDTATNAVTGATSVNNGYGSVRKVVFSPDGSRAYAIGEPYGGRIVTVIDTGTGSVVDTIKAFAGTSDIAASPDGTRVYVLESSNPDYPSSTLSVIDTATNAVITRATGLGATALAVSPDGSRIYVRGDGYVGGNDWSNYRSGILELQSPEGTETVTVTVTDRRGATTAVPVTVSVIPTPLANSGGIRFQPGGILRAVKTSPECVGCGWLVFDPVKGGRYSDEAEVASWLDAAPPDGTGSSGTGPYAAGDMKVNADATLFAIKADPSNTSGTWFIYSPVNGGDYGNDTDVADWFDVPLPTAVV
jgi:YVTN family beta-propeller protein/VCBS repeat-containing protein